MELLTIQYQDIEKDMIERFLLGKIYHIARPEFFKIYDSQKTILKPSLRNKESFYPQTKNSIGYKNDWISLFDMKKITDTIQYRQARSFHMIDEAYIFILKDIYKSSVIFQKDLDMEKYTGVTFYPDFECWSKENIKYDSIDKIIHYKKA